MATRTPNTGKTVETLMHYEATRKNIPTAEFQPVVGNEAEDPIRIAYERRNRDLDPQLVWRGKDEQDWSDLVVHAPPLYIQEKVHPKVLIDDLLRQRNTGVGSSERQLDLFADFNGIPEGADKTDFYQHDANWSNRMILGDSLQVMASLAEREGLRGKVQCIYLDPPYGIKFNSNFQWSTTSRDVTDGKVDHITREPEQVKAFRDTWRDGIHSYLTYLRDRLTVARDLLADSGSIFVQISDENMHRVRVLMDEVFEESNFAAVISFAKTTGQSTKVISQTADYILWYAKLSPAMKHKALFDARKPIENPNERYVCVETEEGPIIDLSVKQKTGELPIPTGRILRLDNLTSQTGGHSSRFTIDFRCGNYIPYANRGWSTSQAGIERLRPCCNSEPGVHRACGSGQVHRLANQCRDGCWPPTTMQPIGPATKAQAAAGARARPAVAHPVRRSAAAGRAVPHPVLRCRVVAARRADQPPRPRLDRLAARLPQVL